MFLFIFYELVLDVLGEFAISLQRPAQVNDSLWLDSLGTLHEILSDLKLTQACKAVLQTIYLFASKCHVCVQTKIRRLSVRGVLPG